MIIKKSVLPRHKLRVVTGKSVGTAGPGSDKNLAQTGPRSRWQLSTGRVAAGCRWSYGQVLPNQTWVHLPEHGEVNLLTWGCEEGKYSASCRAPSKEFRTTCAQKAQTPQ